MEIHCRVRTEAKTGVEMEALTGRPVAALTLYDMGKAVARGIVIREIRLLEKTGGKRDYPRPVIKTVHVRYYAILREQRGVAQEETWRPAAATPAELVRGTARPPWIHPGGRAGPGGAQR